MMNLEVEHFSLSEAEAFTSCQQAIIFNEKHYGVSSKQCLVSTGSESTLLDTSEADLSTILSLQANTILNIVGIITEKSVYVIDPNNKIVPLNLSLIQASFSPVENLIATVDAQNNVSIHHINMSDYSCNLVRSVSLFAEVPDSMRTGWGKATAQFRGSAGKSKPTEITDNQPYNIPEMVWNAEGTLLAVNYWKDNCRFIRIYDNNLEIIGETDKYPFLTSLVAFRLRGTYIASISSSPDISLIIFEKNGKVFSSTKLPQITGRVIELDFHNEMEAFAIVSTNDQSFTLSLFLQTNSEWMLKQQFKFSNQFLDYYIDPASALLRNDLKLSVLTRKGVGNYWLKQRFTRSDKNLLITINGSKLLVNNYHEKLIPPPSASYVIEMDKSINYVSFCPKNNLIASVNDSEIVVLELTSSGYSQKAVLKLDQDENMNFLNVYWKEDTLIIESFKDLDVKKDGSVEFELEIKKEKVFQKSIEENFQLLRDELKLNGIVVCSKVSSFFVKDQYLLVTFPEHLACVKMDRIENLREGLKSPKNLQNIEPGSIVVDVDYACIVKTPRGNLEVVECKLIQLDRVEQLLSEKLFDQAIELMRKKRLNYNLLIELNPKRFCDHVKEIVISLHKQNLMRSFCLQLSLENCELQVADKRKAIALLIQVLETFNHAGLISAIVALKYKMFGLKEALLYLNSFLSLDEASLIWIKKSLQYLLNLESKKDLYKCAHNTYNLHFVKFVAESCGFDPKIYQGEISRLEKLEEIERRFEMAHFAGCPEIAIQYLLRMESSQEEVTKYIVENRVAKSAYLFCPQKHFVIVAQLYAEDLASKRDFNGAGAVASRAGLWNIALNYHIQALDVDQVLIDLAKIDFCQDEKERVLELFAKTLAERGKALESALIYEHYLKKPLESIRVLLAKKLFAQAVQIALTYKLEALDSEIYPNVLDYASNLSYKVSDLKERFLNYFQRLEDWRAKQISKLDNDLEEGDDLESIWSDSGSTVSSSSRASTTARRKRKEQKKKSDLRPGGRYEDIALIKALHETYGEIDKLGVEFESLSNVRFEFDQHDKIKGLLLDIRDLQELAKANLNQIWNSLVVDDLNPEITDSKSIALSRNIAEMDKEYRVPPKINYDLGRFTMFL